MSEHDEVDLNEPGKPEIAFTDTGKEVELPRSKRDVLADLTTLYGNAEDIPSDVIAANELTEAEWRVFCVDMANEKIKEREILADAAAADARDAELRKRGMEPMPPKRPPEEVDAIERGELEREELLRRFREVQEDEETQWDPKGRGRTAYQLTNAPSTQCPTGSGSRTTSGGRSGGFSLTGTTTGWVRK
jgi:hypothetical protein